MTNTYKILAWVTLVLMLGLGLKVTTAPKLGDSLTSTIATHYLNGINAGTSDQFAVDGSGNVTTSGTQTLTGAVSSTANITTTASVSAAKYLTASNNTTASTTVSTTPIAMGSASAGHIVVVTGATTGTASTTAVTANSEIFFTQELATPVPGVTCNTNVVASSSIATNSVIAGNGFTVKVNAAPVTNPFCYAFRITN